MKTASLALVLFAAQLVHGQASASSCSVATLNGTHALVLTGRNIATFAAPLDTVVGVYLQNAYLAVGSAAFDGNGNVTFKLASSTASSSAASQTWSGTYSIPLNCLGTLTITSGDVAVFTLIPYSSGNAFTLTGNDSNYSYTGTGSLQPAACLPATLSGDFAFAGTGYALSSLPSGPIANVNAISGLMTFDGVSAVTANWTVTTGSASSTADSLTGTYTVSSSTCTASATLTDSAGASYNLAFTITSANAANFSAVISSSTFLSTATGHSTFTNPGLAVELAAGDGLPVPPGSLFSIYGSDLSSGTGEFSGTFPLPDTIDSASVTVNGESVPLYYVDKTLINAQMPLDIKPGLATLVVSNGTTKSNAVAVNISATAAPGVFANLNNDAVAQNLPGYSMNSPSNPASVGQTVVVYFTGGGPVTGQASLVTGHATPAAQFPVPQPYSVTLDGVAATVDYIGLVPTAVGGFYQANVVIPKIAAGTHKLIITIGTNTSNTTLISTK